MNRFFVFIVTCIIIKTSIASLQKRDYDNRYYYTLHTVEANAAESAKQVARDLGATFEGQVGELDNYYMISIPKTQQDSIVHHFKKREYSLVDQIQPQVPTKRLYKRAPPPPVIENTDEEYKLNGGIPSLDDANGFQSIKNILDIKDPGFDNQWHLVKLKNSCLC